MEISTHIPCCDGNDLHKTIYAAMERQSFQNAGKIMADEGSRAYIPHRTKAQVSGYRFSFPRLRQEDRTGKAKQNVCRTIKNRQAVPYGFCATALQANQ